MTLTFKQMIALLRNAIKQDDHRDTIMMVEIIERAIKDEPILQMNEEVKEALATANTYLQKLGLLDQVKHPK
jgi:hypothetical protein